MIKEMNHVVQSFNNPSEEDLFYSSKLVKSVASGFSRLVAYNHEPFVYDEDGNEDYSLSQGWNAVDIKSIATDGPVGFNFICLEFNDGGKLPLPILYYNQSEYPLQNEIVGIYRRSEEGKKLLAAIEGAYSSGERLLKEKLLSEVPEGRKKVYMRGQEESYDGRYFYRERNDVIYAFDVSVTDTVIIHACQSAFMSDLANFSETDIRHLNTMANDLLEAKLYPTLDDIFKVE